MRNANVSAVIALDGSYAFQGLSTVLTHAYGYAPENMRATFLDLRRAQGAQGNEPLDLTALESFRHSDRTFITIRKMHHSDFTSFAMVGELFQTPITATYPLNGWNRETAKTGHKQVCRIILAFLGAKFRNDSNALNALAEAVQRADGCVLRHEEATPPPPSPLESAALVSQEDLATVKALFVKICGEQGVGACIDGVRFNTWGYNLLGQNRPEDALAVFELAAWAHPTSANAQDSLADGYLAVGDKENARKTMSGPLNLHQVIRCSMQAQKLRLFPRRQDDYISYSPLARTRRRFRARQCPTDNNRIEGELRGHDFTGLRKLGAHSFQELPTTPA